MEKIDSDEGWETPFAPELIQTYHDCSAFESGVLVLDRWLKQRALKNQYSGATRTYVTCVKKRVVGYYSLAVGSVSHQVATGQIKRNMPDPVPVMLLARLAIHSDWQGKGLGYSLLQDAIIRTISAAEIAGIRAMLVHTLSEDARRFYRHFGFRPSSPDSATLMLLLQNAEQYLIPQ